MENSVLWWRINFFFSNKISANRISSDEFAQKVVKKMVFTGQSVNYIAIKKAIQTSSNITNTMSRQSSKIEGCPSKCPETFLPSETRISGSKKKDRQTYNDQFHTNELLFYRFSTMKFKKFVDRICQYEQNWNVHFVSTPTKKLLEKPLCLMTAFFFCCLVCKPFFRTSRSREKKKLFLDFYWGRHSNGIQRKSFKCFLFSFSHLTMDTMTKSTNCT